MKSTYRKYYIFTASTIAVGGRAETQGEEGGKVEEEREETFRRQKQRNGGGFGTDTQRTVYCIAVASLHT